LATKNKHPADRRERIAVLQEQFREDLRFWIETDRRIALKALELVESVMRDPFTGIGKPEPLKNVLPGTWSRRLTQEHRIVYIVREDRIDFLQARYHY
jgi:toxin YoeB